MRIRNFILIGTLIIIAITVVVIVISGFYFVNGELKYQILAKANDQLNTFNVSMANTTKVNAGYVFDGVLSIYHGADIEKTLYQMKNSSGAQWAFITIGSTNYVYPYEKGVLSLDAKSRPWYILANAHPKNVVINEFYSPTLKASVVTFTVAIDGKVEYVGGLIFTEKQFFNMLSSRIGNPFLIMNHGKIIYPSNLSVNNGIVNINGINYRMQTFDYNAVMSIYDMFSSMPYTLGILIPTSSIISNISWTIFYLVIITVMIGIGEIVFMSFLSRRIALSVEMLSNVSSRFDPHKGEIEVDEKTRERIYRFKETKEVFDKMYQLFQEIIAQIEELRATNEELESSYEEIEQLSNNLSKESQELKELFEVSNLVSLSTDNKSSKRILLDRLIKIYGCAGIILVDLNKREGNLTDAIGEKFNPVDLSKIGKELLNGRIVEVSDPPYQIMVVPIMFESKLLAVLEMAFLDHVPEVEKESLTRFMVGFAGSLNSQRLISEIQNAYIYLATKFVEISEVYDYETGSHIHRVGEYSAFIASKLMMGEEFISNIRIYSMIHDIGKLKVPREILMKNGSLTKEEFEEMKKHTIYGEQLLGEAPFLEMARHIARYHHEKYDGTGYPDGLKGDEIPIEGRIMAIADVYDALRSPRRYKRAFSHEEAVKIILEGDGRTKPDHFDPKILEIFRKYNLEFKRIYESLLDEEEKNG
ncbi:MAG: HD domain-containing phosphohydrolase [Athalassotoga sp.]|uniref:HD domain-containing phosphohydrolase n=1 Tax=Athalassotoga sp. TaxID=2022597 RepID=UPI003D0669F8